MCVCVGGGGGGGGGDACVNCGRVPLSPCTLHVIKI